MLGGVIQNIKMNNNSLKPKKRKVRSYKGCKGGKYKKSIRKEREKKSPDEKKKYVCKLCGYVTINKTNNLIHYLNYHATLEERINKYKYYCKTCNFGVMSKGLYDTHLTTKKHKYLTRLTQNN